MPFAVVGFAKRNEVMKAVERLNGIEIRGNIVLLKEADYKRGIFNKCNEMRICSKMDCTTMKKTYK